MKTTNKVIRYVILEIDYWLLRLMGGILIDRKKIRFCHISMDDVSFCMDYNRIGIEENTLSYLEKLGCPVTLFLYKKVEISTSYRFLSNSNIVFNYHLVKFYEDANIVPPTSSYSRFHYYKASSLDLKKFAIWGGKVLFTCHDNYRVSYDLNEYENKQVNTLYKYSKNGIGYIKTDIRLEWPIVIQLLKTKPHALLVVFGHECTMSRYAKRLNFLVKILKNKQIKLIK